MHKGLASHNLRKEMLHLQRQDSEIGRMPLTRKKAFTSTNHRNTTKKRLLTIPGTSKGDIGEVICNQHAAGKKHNREILLKILGNIRYLGKRRLL